jgi:ABC-type lipoprotein export system ATPase subunit
LTVADKDLLKFKEKDYIAYKRDTVGFVWQNNARNLIPYMTATENVQLPMVLTNASKRVERAKMLLDMVDLSDRANSKLSQLSGGEQQRVAIAIALANEPKLLLADEPTGALDSRTANMILDIFRNVGRATGLTIVIVTHDISLSRRVDRVVAIRDGRTLSEFIRRKSYAQEMAELGELGHVDHQEDADAQVELAVVDSTGHMQIPREYLNAIGITGKSRVKVEMEDDRVVIINPETIQSRHRAEKSS